MPQLIKDGVVEGLMLHFNLLVRQIGSISTCIWGFMRAPAFGRPTLPYALFAKTELADMTAHIRELCVLLGLDFWEVELLGRQRRIEKRAEFEQRHPTVPWV